MSQQHVCPYCHATDRQVKAGRNVSGSQRYPCQHCQRKYTPEPKPQGYDEATRRLPLYVDGMNFCRIARTLGVSHRSVSHRVNAYAAQVPDLAPVPAEELQVNELDELCTFVREKNKVYVVTQVDRASRCLVGWVVVAERTPPALQAMLDRSPQADPQADQYYSDAYPLYQALLYSPGQHQAFADKSQTYSVEADNAELRHDLARLARRSRCFSRCIQALRTAIKLFVFAWNRRQMHKRRFPSYTAHLRDFICP